MRDRGVGKCPQGHLGSYGYPTRPRRPYRYCPQCGNRMAWVCARCGEALPDDPQELTTANFCRNCGEAYFPNPQTQG